MTRYYKCSDGHETEQWAAEILPPRVSCPVFVSDPALKGASGPMILCGKPLTLTHTDDSGSFAEAYTSVFLRN